MKGLQLKKTRTKILGITGADLASFLSVSENSVRKWEASDQINDKAISRFSNANVVARDNKGNLHNLNLYDIITGGYETKEDLKKLTGGTRIIGFDFLNNSVDNQQLINEPAESYSVKSNKTPYYPSVNIAKTKGGVEDIISDIVTDKILIDDPLFNKADFILQNYGDNNTPLIKNGDLVGYKKINNVRSLDLTKMYLIVNNNMQLFNNRLEQHDSEEKFWVVSENKKYKPFILYKEDILELYEIVAVGGKLSI